MTLLRRRLWGCGALGRGFVRVGRAALRLGSDRVGGGGALFSGAVARKRMKGGGILRSGGVGV